MADDVEYMVTLHRHISILNIRLEADSKLSYYMPILVRSCQSPRLHDQIQP